MKLASNQLEAFYEVAQQLSFSKAGRSLGLTQSAVSQRVAQLEEQLKTSLFIRDRAQLKITDSGKNLLRYSQRLQQSESELLSLFEGGQPNLLSGQVRVAGFSSVTRSVLLPALTPLIQKNPNLQLTLMTKELRELESVLKTAEVDYIVTNQNPNREDIECIPLGIEENILAEMKGMRVPEVYLDHDSSNVTTDSFFKKIKKSDKSVKRLYVDDVYGLIDGAKLGLGKAILPRHLIKNEKNLKVISNESLKVSVFLVFYRQPYLSYLHQHIVDHITSHFKKILPSLG